MLVLYLVCHIEVKWMAKTMNPSHVERIELVVSEANDARLVGLDVVAAVITAVVQSRNHDHYIVSSHLQTVMVIR